MSSETSSREPGHSSPVRYAAVFYTHGWKCEIPTGLAHISNKDKQKDYTSSCIQHESCFSFWCFNIFMIYFKSDTKSKENGIMNPQIPSPSFNNEQPRADLAPFMPTLIPLSLDYFQVNLTSLYHSLINISTCVFKRLEFYFYAQPQHYHAVEKHLQWLLDDIKWPTMFCMILHKLITHRLMHSHENDSCHR